MIIQMNYVHHHHQYHYQVPQYHKYQIFHHSQMVVIHIMIIKQMQIVCTTPNNNDGNHDNSKYVDAKLFNRNISTIELHKSDNTNAFTVSYDNEDNEPICDYESMGDDNDNTTNFCMMYLGFVKVYHLVI
eukprot:189840_1